MTTKRAYDNALRAGRAAQTRARVLEAAAEIFTARGWAGATVAQIAARADVCADTVGATGSKGFLLLEAFRRRYTGDSGWRSLLELDRVQEIFAIDDPRRGLDATVDFLVAAHRDSARLWLVVRATALTEPVVAEGLAELLRLKEESFRVTVRWLQRLGLVAMVPDDEFPRLVAEVNLVMSAETYLQLIDDYGWDEDRYRRWVRRSLLALGTPAG